jgi:hypothetical protein
MHTAARTVTETPGRDHFFSMDTPSLTPSAVACIDTDARAVGRGHANNFSRMKNYFLFIGEKILALCGD